jgi:GAF domain-containing protein
MSADNPQVVDAAPWVLRFEDPDIGMFLDEAIGEFVDDLGASGRGIGWTITLLRAEGSLTLASSNAASETVDRLQSEFDDGPSRAAVRTGEFVLISDMQRERRWSGYASIAAGLGIRSGLFVPLIPAQSFRAAFNLYAAPPHVFTSADIINAVRFIRHASRTLRLVQRTGKRDVGGADLNSAQLSRALAALALRTLLREYGLTVEESLEYLRRAAGNLPQPEQGFPEAGREPYQTSVDPLEGSSFRAARASKPRTSRRHPAPERSA